MPVFDTDFGRIAMLTCFDANFDEVWQEAERKGAEIVFWPSAYGGGMPLNGYAMIHNYYVVAVGRGNIIDIFGKTIEGVEKPRPQQFIATLDLDRTLVHTNFNEEKVAKLLREHPGEVVQEQFLDMESWYVLRSLKPGVLVRDLCKQYQIETLREYRQRSRDADQRRSDARARRSETGSARGGAFAVGDRVADASWGGIAVEEETVTGEELDHIACGCFLAEVHDLGFQRGNPLLNAPVRDSPRPARSAYLSAKTRETRKPRRSRRVSRLVVAAARRPADSRRVVPAAAAMHAERAPRRSRRIVFANVAASA